jgi:hypothetical protein
MTEREFKRLELVAHISARLYATQLAQIQVWKADDVNLDRLEEHCVDSAVSIVWKSENKLGCQ